MFSLDSDEDWLSIETITKSELKCLPDFNELFEPNCAANFEFTEEEYTELITEQYLEKLENGMNKTSEVNPGEFASYLLTLNKMAHSNKISLQTKIRMNKFQLMIIDTLISWTRSRL